MKKNINNLEITSQDGSFLLVPIHLLKRIDENLEKISHYMEGGEKKAESINGYVSEKQAMAKFKKSHTWFWEKRRAALLPFSKIGKTIYYLEADLHNLIKSEI